MDVTKPFPYRAETFDCVFCSHLLEHLHREKAVVLVKEVYRILKQGGILRISVPNLDRIVAGYDVNHPEIFLEGIFEAKQKGNKNRHHWHYNETSLSKLLHETGFSEICNCEFRQGRCPDVALIDNRPESLFIEAVK
jgi:predicted SAM-dependent methyltransferase